MNGRPSAGGRHAAPQRCLHIARRGGTTPSGLERQPLHPGTQEMNRREQGSRSRLAKILAASETKLSFWGAV
jgi:hypothetical protein